MAQQPPAVPRGVSSQQLLHCQSSPHLLLPVCLPPQLSSPVVVEEEGEDEAPGEGEDGSRYYRYYVSSRGEGAAAAEVSSAARWEEIGRAHV